MKFRKEYQTYLLIVIAIITTGYFLKPFFFNKKKKVIEGQAGATTYYRIAFNSTDSIVTSALTLAQQDLLKELILTQYDTVLTDDAGIQYVQPGDKYKVLIQLIPDTDTLLIKDSTGEIIGLKVVALCGNRLEYFKKKAAAAAADTADSAAAAAAAYDYARLILSNDATYKADANIMALIAAANLFTIVGQPNIIITDKVVNTAKKAAEGLALTASARVTMPSALKAASVAGDFFISDEAEAAYIAALVSNTPPPVGTTFFISDEAEAAFMAAFNAAMKAFAVAFIDAIKAANIAFDVDYYAAAAGMYAYTAPAHYAAALADAYAKGITLTSATITSNVNYQKVITKYDKAAFTTAAGLIYQSIYEIINKI